MTDRDAHADADREWLINQVAHALRNPIFAVSVQTETLQLRANDPTAVYETAAKLHAQLQRLSGNIDEMLLFGRPVRARFEDVNVAELLATLADRYAAGARVEPARIATGEVEPGLTGRWDRTAVVVILERLLDNAVQHTSEPHEIRITAEATDGHTATFSVIDAGEGIPDAILDRALLPFFPQHNGRPGLGLAIADKFARFLGGRIEIDTTEGEGTTVRCVLPINGDA